MLSKDELISIAVATVLAYSILVVLVSSVVIYEVLPISIAGAVVGFSVFMLALYGVSTLTRLSLKNENFKERFFLWLTFLLFIPSSISLVAPVKSALMLIAMTIYALATPVYLGGIERNVKSPPGDDDTVGKDEGIRRGKERG